MDRTTKRKLNAETASIVSKAKKDMEKWMSSLDYIPSTKEIKSWQAGYIAGINRGSNVPK
jgi:hypothetical protein